MKFNHILNGSYSYQEYLDLTSQLVEEGKTTGPSQSQNLIDFTALNQHRMKRLNKTVKLSDDLKNKLKTIGKQRWIVITEAWCGDAAQNVPLLARMAEENGEVELKMILRDENLPIMDDFLTNGGRSIPKLIALDENDEVLFSWGPRPAEAQAMQQEYKANPNGRTYNDFNTELHTWYARDKTRSAQEEFLALL